MLICRLLAAADGGGTIKRGAQASKKHGVATVIATVKEIVEKLFRVGQ